MYASRNVTLRTVDAIEPIVSPTPLAFTRSITTFCVLSFTSKQSSWFQTAESWIHTPSQPLKSKPSVLNAVRSTAPWPSRDVRRASMREYRTSRFVMPSPRKVQYGESLRKRCSSRMSAESEILSRRGRFSDLIK